MFKGDRLKNERENKGFTMSALGEAIGVAKQTINSYEKGEKQPTISNLIKLCEVLDCSSDYLIGLSDDPRFNLVRLTDEQHTYEVKVDKTQDKNNITLEDIYNLLKELKK